MRRPRSPAGHARGRARWRARNHSAVHGPSPRIAVEPRAHLVVGQVGELVEVEVGAREADRRTRPCGCEKPSATSSSSVAAATRSRVGKPYASRPGSPKRSISRERIANAEKSETCCAVIDVTRLSNGSGASGGRKPSSFGTSSSSTGCPAAQAVNGVEVELEPEQLRDDGPGLGVERLDVDAAGRRLDPHLARADHAVEAALVPEVREVDAERAEALGREREVVRLR